MLKEMLIRGLAITLIGVTFYYGINKLEDKIWSEFQESLKPTIDIIEKLPREYKNETLRQISYKSNYFS